MNSWWNILVGLRVYDSRMHKYGIICEVSTNIISIDYDGIIEHYRFPAAFASILELEDSDLQKEIMSESLSSDFEGFKSLYIKAIHDEISYVKREGGKRYRIFDGVVIQKKMEMYLYTFETDVEMHFPDDTEIRLFHEGKLYFAAIKGCEDYTIFIQVDAFLGDKVESVEFSAEPWYLMESLVERLDSIDPVRSVIAHDVACVGRNKIDQRHPVVLGQNAAFNKCISEPVTFIWGPPGTGKTNTLAAVALEHIHNGKRVLMVSYSNVSVDGAVLRVAERSDNPEGKIFRYGYPRNSELAENKALNAYSYAIYKNPELAEAYEDLLARKKGLRKKDPDRASINEQLKKIRSKIRDKEIELIQNAPFIATTISKAIVDKAIYSQSFDVVIVDEASMAYIPQIVFASSLAKQHFCCMGDFRQLAAIVQNPQDDLLSEDIFEHTGISKAVESGYGHEWLVMLDTQYRMHPDIAQFASEYMYEGMLKSAMNLRSLRQDIADCLPMYGESMSMVDLNGAYSVCIKTMDGSHINLLSAMVCIRLVEYLVESYAIGVITPYNAQSRLILAMIRDLQERDTKYNKVACATVHQFQGSEKPVIIYDAVDCFRMPYPGMLLTSMKNDMANRLFNVALTRTQGKFLLVANSDFLSRKKISDKLLFTKLLQELKKMKVVIKGNQILDEIGTAEEEAAEMFYGDRDEEDSWNRYLDDLSDAQNEIFMEVPGNIDDDQDALDELLLELKKAETRGVGICIRVEENTSIPIDFKQYEQRKQYVTTPFTVIDKKTIWYGEPLSAANFISEGKVIKTKTFPCMRFEGKHLARMLKAIYEIPDLF